jgi:heterodisulfide reductase subunit B
MKRVSYYPGCSLEGMANDYARSIEAVFEDLGITLVEIEDWSCCGSTAAHSLSEMMSVALPARNLAVAEKLGLDIVSPCAMCFNRLRFSQNMLQKGLFDVPWTVSGDLRVHDMTRFLAEPDMLRKIQKRIIRPLKGLRLVCYYGCQMVRPPKITGYRDYENPQTLDRLTQAVGADVIDWSYKATCCGASIGIGRKDIQTTLTERILLKAVQAGAEAVVVSCALCQSNLDIFQQNHPEIALPVFYFTELLRLAFAAETKNRWFKKHFVDPVPLLARKGLIV